MGRPGRATFAPDIGRRGSLRVLSAFELAAGLASTRHSARRDSASFIQLLEQVLPDLLRAGVGVDRRLI
jgi:hypothetical protein